MDYTKLIVGKPCKVCGCIIRDDDDEAVYQEAMESSSRMPRSLRAMLPAYLMKDGPICGKCHERQDRELFGII